MRNSTIKEETDDPSTDIALDTVAKNKQAIFFVNSKRGAEALAEKIAKKLKESDDCKDLSQNIAETLPKPTKQCLRLSSIAKKGAAFHHAGLHARQREMIENNFRSGQVKIICATPTLCISKNTRIWSQSSSIEVARFDIKKPVYVLSDNKLNVVKAKEIMKMQNVSPLIKISSVSGYAIKVTPQHKMLIKRAGKKKIVTADQVMKTDKIGTVGRLTISRTRNPHIREFVKENRIEIRTFAFEQCMSYFIGAMLGDGYSGAETKEGHILYKGSPAIVGIDKEIFSKVEECCEHLNVSCRKSKTFHGTPQLILGKNKWFRELLVRCGIEKGERKHLSEKLMMMDIENTSWLLKGLFDTDGFVQKRVGPGFCSISKELIEQVQKLLLRYNIVSVIRVKKAGSMSIYGKEYKTKELFELGIHNKRCIIDFYRHVGFHVGRKQEALLGLVSQFVSNVNHISCANCDYKLYRDLFSGRSKEHKEWGRVKQEVVVLLGKKGELQSNDIRRILEKNPRKRENRLNHHYELIQKRKRGKISQTEWFWSLNEIGMWIYRNILSKGKKFIEVFKLHKCPLCREKLEWTIKDGWKSADFEGDIYWDIIKEIKVEDIEDEVYDVVLSDNQVHDHLFVAEGFIIHNSYGLDLPAFRVVVRDVKRFGRTGMDFIPVLEYEQMCGRAGRPGKEDYGEAVVVAQSEGEKEKLIERYLKGKPEVIYSKLAVEPVLRTYILSLVASEFVHDIDGLMDFFERTFYAHQFKDLYELKRIIMKMLALLEEWEFIRRDGESEFRSADKLRTEGLSATPLGKRVSELYLDPLSAHFIISCLKRSTAKTPEVFSFLMMIGRCNEISPRLRVKMADVDAINEKYVEREKFFLEDEPSEFSPDYEEFMDSFKTALFFEEWLDEKDEEFLLEEFSVRPGEIHVKLDLADWLVYCTEEIARMQGFHHLLTGLMKLRVRLKYGVKAELLPLLKLKNVGRARARLMFRNNIRSLSDVRKVEQKALAAVLGPNVAADIKKQVGEKEVNEDEQTSFSQG